MSWISTEEYIPDVKERVLVWTSAGKPINIDTIRLDRKKPYGYEWCSKDNVKFWMYLPEDPNE